MTPKHGSEQLNEFWKKEHSKGDKELMEVLKEIPKEDVEILLIKLNTLKK